MLTIRPIDLKSANAYVLANHRHNKSESYRRAVLDNLEVIRRYEAARKAITK